MGLKQEFGFKSDGPVLGSGPGMPAQPSEYLPDTGPVSNWNLTDRFIWSDDNGYIELSPLDADPLLPASGQDAPENFLLTDTESAANSLPPGDTDRFEYSFRANDGNDAPASSLPRDAGMARTAVDGDAYRAAAAYRESFPVQADASETAIAYSGKVPAAATGDPVASLQLIPTEPLFGNQWFLRNTGQSGGQPGIDINVTGVWDDYTGAGIRVGVVDDGIEYTHPDLDANYNPAGGYDYGGNDGDPFPGPSDPHGTAVAGLIAAENNGVGSIGVAYDSTLTAFRIFGGGITEAEYAAVYNGHVADLDVSNNSWGFNGFFYDNLDGANFDSVGTAIENAVTNGRGGLGTVLLWAAGNDRVDGQDVNYHGFQNARESIAVAAVDNTGKISFYSTPGAAILISAPSNGGTAGIVTTDRTGSLGYASGDYTFSFGGTSAATPITAGVVALMLEANPDLGYRDVQEILAYSARQVDPGDAGWTYNDAYNWNGGGLHTSNDFGFGLIDARAAVRLSETWLDQSTRANEIVVSASSAPNLTIADNATVSDTVLIGGGLDIDQVEVDIGIVHSWIGDLTVTLTAPDGTQSVLVNRPGKSASSTFGSGQNDINFTLSSTNYWGETGTGTWTLSVTDSAAQGQGVLVDWTLKLFGDAADTNDLYVFTDEYAGFDGDPSRQNLTDGGGIDTINAAAITAGSLINLANLAAGTPVGISDANWTGSIAAQTSQILQASGLDALSLAGNALIIDEASIIENAFAGDGDDILIGNAAGNLLIGGRGNDILIGGAGLDTLDGGAGDDLFVVAAGDGQDVIEGFVAGAAAGDLIDLAGQSAFTDFSALLAAATDDGTNTAIAFGAGDSLTLAGVRKIDLTAGDFNLAEPTIPPGVTLIGGAGDDTLSGGAGDDVLSGLGGNDVLSGGAGADTLDGGLGDDTLLGGAGQDSLSGGDGIDTASYADATSWVYARLDWGLGFAGNIDADTLTGIENLTGGTGGSFLFGDAGDNVLTGGDSVVAANAMYGGDGADTIHGGSGLDYVQGDGGNDLIFGNGGDDELRGGAGNDILNGGAGIDTLDGGLGDDTLLGGAGQDSLSGGDGIDTVSYADTTSWVYVRLDTGVGVGGDADGDTLTGIENLTGGTGGAILFGDAGNNVLTGGDSVSEANAIFGGDGADTINGGSGLDYVQGDGGADLIFGNGGSDELLGGAGNDTLAGGIGNDTLYGGTGDDVFIFNDGTGSDIIQDFFAGAGTEDRIDFAGVSSLASFNDVQSQAAQSGADLAIDLGNGDAVVLIGVQLIEIHPDDFIF